MSEAKGHIRYVKPREGARIIQPNRNYRAMPIEGDFVDLNDVFYQRLYDTGDIVDAMAPSREKKPKSGKFE